MSIQPLLDAPLAVQVHVVTIIPAAVIGGILLCGKKGTAKHRMLGRVWFILMAISAGSTFFIHGIDLAFGFSPIHLLSLYVLYGCARAISAIRHGNVERHRSEVRSMYFGGIVLAGALTLLPGRTMHQVVFTNPVVAVVFLALACLAGALIYLLRRIDIRTGDGK